MDATSRSNSEITHTLRPLFSLCVFPQRVLRYGEQTCRTPSQQTAHLRSRLVAMPFRIARALLVASALTTVASSTNSRDSVTYPSLQVVESALRTTAKSDFGGHSKAFEAAAAWDGERFRAQKHIKQPRRSSPGAPPVLHRLPTRPRGLLPASRLLVYRGGAACGSL